MNLELLENFHQNHPEANDGALDCLSFAITCEFNRPGTLLAVGCNDGRVEIWDFLTRGCAKFIMAHVHPVCSLSWSRDSRLLASASTDNSLAVWDVLSGDAIRTFRFPCPVLKVQFHPRNHTIILVCPLKHPPVLLNTETNRTTVLRLDDSDPNIIASFDRKGRHIFTANAKGKVAIFRAEDLNFVNSFRATNAASNTTVKSIEFSRRGGFFLLNCSDRVIRVYRCQDALTGKTEPEPIQKLKDLVTQSHWRKCCFSGDGEYICAGSVKQHSIYIWERAAGTLVKILQGTKGETMLDAAWHPLRPIIVSISNGVVTIWAQTQVQNWSAFAPDFKELDENVEYEERESEFDLEDEDKEVEPQKGEETEDIEIDVLKVEPIPALLSSDEEEGIEENTLMYLPIAPDIEDSDEFSAVADSSSAAEMSASEDRGMSGDSASESPTKKRRRDGSFGTSNRPPPVDIDLPDAHYDEPHPLIQSKRSTGTASAGAFAASKSRQALAGLSGSGTGAASGGASGGAGFGGRKTSRNQRDRTKSKSKP